MNKQMSLAEVVAELRDGMTIGIGSWGPRRSMALIRESCAQLKDLALVAYGGPEIGMLCAAGKARRLIYGFVSLDFIPTEPFFRKAREAGGVEASELDEGLLVLGLQAAGHRLPFLPTRIGLGSDVTAFNPGFRTVKSPQTTAGRYSPCGAQARRRADPRQPRAGGQHQTDGPDPYFDALFARAAERCYVTAEEVVDRMDLSYPHGARSNLFERYLVTGVVEAPLGAHPTASHDAYGWDTDHLKEYAALAGAEGGWQKYFETYVGADEAGYLDRVGGAARVRGLPLPVM